MAPPKKNFKWSYLIEASKCKNCATCWLECRDDAIYVEDNANYAIDQDKCQRCARCYNACPVEAIQRVPFEAAS